MGRDKEWESGAEGLWSAVLMVAVEDVRGQRLLIGSLRGRLIIRSTRQWFQSSEGGVGSLAWICDALGLEVEGVRGLALEVVAPVPLTIPRDASPLGNSLSVRDAVGVPREGKFDFP